MKKEELNGSPIKVKFSRMRNNLTTAHISNLSLSHGNKIIHVSMFNRPFIKLYLQE